MTESASRAIWVISPHLGRRAEVGRVMGEFGEGDGPTLVIIAGLHGNEPAGVFAFLELLSHLRESQVKFRGKLVGLAGNLTALEKRTRFIDADLNRLWRREIVDACLQDRVPVDKAAWVELRELRELYAEIRQRLAQHSGPFYFIDLHTTSSVSPPFVLFDDTLVNRAFVEQFPIPGILGVEEYLPGTLLSYIIGHRAVGVGYEAGQHNAPQSVKYHLAMLGLALERVGCVRREDFPRLGEYQRLLQDAAEGVTGFYEIRYRYAVGPDEGFRMLPGQKSFQSIRRDQPLAENLHGPISAPSKGLLFMPLYQDQGNDGFFIVSPVRRFWLQLSKRLRQWRGERLLAWLPGVNLESAETGRLVVNQRVARLLARQIFHLLGYRLYRQHDGRLFFERRD